MAPTLSSRPVPTLSADALVPEVSRVFSLFQAFSTLSAEHFGAEPGGKLLLYGEMDAEGAALALAGNIAGAATLGIDGNAERLKQGIRHGFCDFLVNHLDEALRILKNEIRKKQPVSVCLEGDFASILREIVLRGVQPDVLGCRSAEAEGDTAVLVGRGSLVLGDPVSRSDSLGEVTWQVQRAPALWLPKVDALAAAALPAADARRRWLRLAPRYLGRSLAARRYLRLTPAELQSFSAMLEAAIAAGEVDTSVTIRSLPALLPPPR